MADNQLTRLGCAGLVSDPGPFSGVPDGAMVEAQNVAFRRPGVAEPRPPLTFTKDSTASGTCYGAFAFDDGTSVATQWIGSSGWRSNGTTTVSGGFTFSQYKTRHSSYRGRGFFTSDQGIAVLDGASDTSARLAGVPRGPGFYTSVTASAGSWLKTGYVTGYRTVVARSLNGTIARGTPSEVRLVANGASFVSASDLYVSLRIYITPDIVAGDYVEVYRLPYTAGTVNSYYLDGAPSDEARLRASLRVTASDVSTGYIDYVDYASDAQFDGPYLYTNASQEGILLANERPNYCIDVGVYNRMHFFAGHRSPQRVTLTAYSVGLPNDVNVLWTSGTDMTRRLCGGVVSASVTTGSTTLTLTSAATDLQYLAVGQYITIGSGTGDDPETGNASLPANTQIVSINAGAGTAVMSKQAGTTGAVVVRLYDWIEVDDGAKRRIYTTADNAGTYPPRANILTTFTNLWLGRNEWNGYYGGVSGTAYAGGAPDIERAWAASYGTASFRVSSVAAGPKNNESVVIRIERTDASLGSFTVRSSKPLAFDQYVDSVTGVTSSQEGTPGRLAWSKLDEPESAPLPFYQDIGDPNLPIYRIMAVQDALYVFKADGLWRCFGDDPQNLVIQQVDATARLTLGMAGCVARYGDSVYAWTKKGIIECSGLGVRNVDAAIYNTANAPLENVNVNYLNGWAVASWYGRWIAFSMGSSSTIPAYVYFPESGLWASWTFPQQITAASTPIGGTASSNNAPIVGFVSGYAQANIPWVDTTNVGPFTYLCGGDIIGGVQVTSASGATIGIAGGSLWTPAVGDAIVADVSGPYYVTAVASSTSFTVDRSGLTTGYPAVYDAYPAKVTWTASATNNVASEKHYTDSMFLFSRMVNGRYFTERYQGYKNNTESTKTANYDPTGTKFATVKPYVRRSHVPVSVSRDWALKLGFTFTQGCTFWTLDGAAISFSDAGTRL